MFADDTELYNSAHHSSADSLFCNMQNCVSDVKKWTIHNKLQLNENKTEVVLFDPTKFSSFPDVLRIGLSDIPFCNSALNLGVMFDSRLTMKQQFERIFQTAYFEIRRIRPIRQFSTTEATQILVTSLVLSR